MAKKNPEHYRAEFTFGAGNVCVQCSCGKWEFKPSFPQAVTWLEQHHMSVIVSGGEHLIYKED